MYRSWLLICRLQGNLKAGPRIGPKKPKDLFKGCIGFCLALDFKGQRILQTINGINELKKFALNRPSTALRPLEGTKGAGDRQGPLAINTEVERNRLSKKMASASLGWPRGRLRVLKGAGDRQGPSGINAEVKRNHLSQKKFRPRPALDGLWRPPEDIILEGKAIFELVLT